MCIDTTISIVFVRVYPDCLEVLQINFRTLVKQYICTGEMPADSVKGLKTVIYNVVFQ